MSNKYLEQVGTPIMASQLALAKAADFAKAVIAGPYVELIECRLKNNGDEVVVIRVEVELGQVLAHEIEREERLAVVFGAQDKETPQVLALRENFPLVPHLLTWEHIYPRSLCLFSQSYDELKIHWSGTFLIKQIRKWLSLTARGELHESDQPLEPLLPFTTSNLILPADFFEKNKESAGLSVAKFIDDVSDQITLIMKWATPEDTRYGNHSFLPITLKTAPMNHGVINSKPKNIFELHQFLKKGDLDLLSKLRSEFKAIKSPHTQLLLAKLILIVILPKKRSSSQAVESYDIRSFMVDQTLGEIGVQIGVWDASPETSGAEFGQIIGFDSTKNGTELTLAMLNTTFAFSKNLAKEISKRSKRVDSNIVAVGGGALGSQVFSNLIRAGYGCWSIIDKDFLAPHNLARHTLTSQYVGYPKSTSLAQVANNLLNQVVAEGIVDNVLRPTNPEKITNVIEKADLILDFSASVAVARYLAQDLDSSVRRISLFLNPAGTDLVILSEDEGREFKLDLLEMLYYRFLINQPQLNDHLKENNEQIRYATSCRDISSHISQDLVSLHASVASRVLQEIDVTSGDQGAISIWRTDPYQMTVNRYSFSTAGQRIELKFDEWTLITDQVFIDKVHKARAEKLPNETGGILIGSYDKERKIIYGVDTVLSPPDSQEWPTVYVRGCAGLEQKLQEISMHTANNLEYIGEWHSHPQGASCAPSATDVDAFSQLKEMMDTYSLPTLMMIVGDPDQFEFYLNELKA